MLLHFKILLQWDYEMLYIWDHLQNCYILKLKLLHLWEYIKKYVLLFAESAAFPGKSTNLLLLV